MKHIALIAALTVIAAASCTEGAGKNRSKDCCALDDISFIKHFPVEKNLKEYTILPINPIGAIDILLDKDNHLWVSGSFSKGRLLAAYDLSSNEILGSFLYRGNGPEEVQNRPFLNNWKYTEGNHLILGLNTGRLSWMEIDLTASLNSGALQTVNIQAAPKGAEMHILGLPGGDIWYTRMASDMQGIVRELGGTEGTRTIPAMDKLNSFSISKKNDGYNFNILSINPRYNAGLNRMAEVSIFLNTVHLYDLDGPFAKTVCIGDKITRISDLEKKNLTLVREMFSGCKAYGNRIALFGRDTLYIIDWEGNPIAKYRLPVKHSYFAIDFDNDILYAIGADDEKIYRYSLQ